MRRVGCLLAVAALFLAADVAQAGVVQVGTQAEFSGKGTINQNTNWDAYGPGWTYPGSPFTVGDLTFVAGGETLIGGIDDYGMARNLLTDDQIAGTTTLTANTYDLFAFNAGNFWTSAAASFVVTTNLGSYSFTETVPSYAYGGSLLFLGWQATGDGEYFTSVAWSGTGATGVTDVQLGTTRTTTNVVPLPSAALMGIVLLAGLGVLTRRRKR